MKNLLARAKRVSSLQVYTQHPESGSRAYWTSVEPGTRTSFRNDSVCADGFSVLTAGLIPGIDFHFLLLWTLAWLTHSKISLSAASCQGCPLEGTSSKTSHYQNIWLYFKCICGSAYPYPLSRLLTLSVWHMSVPLQSSTVCLSPLAMYLMEVGNPVRCLQQGLPNLFANVCARSSVIASSTLGGMKVALANSNWNAK